MKLSHFAQWQQIWTVRCSFSLQEDFFFHVLAFRSGLLSSDYCLWCHCVYFINHMVRRHDCVSTSDRSREVKTKRDRHTSLGLRMFVFFSSGLVENLGLFLFCIYFPGKVLKCSISLGKSDTTDASLLLPCQVNFLSNYEIKNNGNGLVVVFVLYLLYWLLEHLEFWGLTSTSLTLEYILMLCSSSLNPFMHEWLNQKK